MRQRVLEISVDDPVQGDFPWGGPSAAGPTASSSLGWHHAEFRKGRRQEALSDAPVFSGGAQLFDESPGPGQVTLCLLDAAVGPAQPRQLRVRPPSRPWQPNDRGDLERAPQRGLRGSY